MATDAQVQANRMNAQKSTGPKTAEGKAIAAQNAVKHGLFAHENVIRCEKQADFDRFRDELLSALASVGGVEAMLAEQIVSLSWRLKRAERMSNEVLDVKIAQATAGSWDQSRRREAGLAEDSGDGLPELILGWATIRDFADAQILERLLLYEKRIESSLYKAMNELQKLQLFRKKEQIETMKSGAAQPSPSLRDEAATHSMETDEKKKQTQSCLSAASANPAVHLSKQSQFNSSRDVVKACDKNGYENSTHRGQGCRLLNDQNASSCGVALASKLSGPKP